MLRLRKINYGRGFQRASGAFPRTWEDLARVARANASLPMPSKKQRLSSRRCKESGREAFARPQSAFAANSFSRIGPADNLALLKLRTKEVAPQYSPAALLAVAYDPPTGGEVGGDGQDKTDDNAANPQLNTQP